MGEVHFYPLETNHIAAERETAQPDPNSLVFVIYEDTQPKIRIRNKNDT